MLGPSLAEHFYRIGLDRAVTDRIAYLARAVGRWCAVAALALLSVLLGLALSHGLAHERFSRLPAERSAVSSRQRSTSLPLPAQEAISAALGANDPAYRLIGSAGTYRAVSPAQHLVASFGRSGVELSAGSVDLAINLHAFGYGASLHPVGSVSPRTQANRAVYARAGLSEWYVNGPSGLEQGFTLAQAPVGDPTGPLTLAIALSGNVHASLGAGGQSLTLSHAGSTLRYAGLSVSDARGRTQHSWLQLAAGRVLLRVDTYGARYPLQIDPLIQRVEKLTDSEQSADGQLGSSVALSANGNIAVVGGPGENARAGAAWVFTCSGSTWTQQAQLTGGSEDSGEGHFGASVALSSDGSTAVIGAPGDSGEAGAAWIFTRSGSTWTRQARLTDGTEESADGQFGASVALSADGSTALIGAPGDSGGVGAVWVFTPKEEGWRQEGGKLTAGSGEESVEGWFGSSVALSSNGGVALIGAPGYNGGVGAAWIFIQEEEIWSQVGGKLTAKASEESGAGAFGSSIALSSDGSTALIGAPGDSGGVGAAWALTRVGEVWDQQGTKLTGSEESQDGRFGSSVALSSDGDAALIGGPDDGGEKGAAWTFTHAGSIWAEGGEKLTAETNEETEKGQFGASVALSSDGVTGVIGGPGDTGAIGAIWVFISPPPSVTNVSPDSGPIGGGTTVTITGTNLGEATAVGFGSTSATSFKVNSATSITAVAPAGTGTVEVTVSAPGGESATSVADQFSYVPAPTVTEVSPNRGAEAGGTSVTITGTNLGEATSVKFGSSVASVTADSESSITALAPAGSGTVDVAVSTAGGTSATGAADNFIYVPPPSVTNVSPNAGPLGGGTSVTITGSNFNEVTAVEFGAKSVTSFRVNSETSITATALAGTGTVDVTVSTVGGTSAASAADQFSYLPVPTVTAVSPKIGPLTGGAKVTVDGTNFTANTAVKFGANSAQVVEVDSETSLTVVSPAGSGTGDVTVTTPGGTSAISEAGSFSYPGPPTVVAEKATEINQTEANLHAAADLHGATLRVCYFNVFSSVTDERVTSAECAVEPDGKAAAWALELLPETEYYFSVLVENDFGEYEFAEGEKFKTLPGPDADTGAVVAVTQSSVTLEATVNPNGGKVTNCHFEYGTSESLSSATSMPCEPKEPGAGTTPVPVSASLTGLSVNKTYHFRIVATNPGGTTHGSIQSFNTLPNLPTVATGVASSVTQTSATLNATVNPSGVALSECRFEYGISTSYGSSVVCSSLPSGGAEMPVSASLGALTPNTTYHFRISATNMGGASQGGDGSFMTAPATPPATTIATGTTGMTDMPTPMGSVGVAGYSSASHPCRVSLAGAKLAARAGGVVSVKLTWTAAEAGICRGTLTLKAKIRGTGGRTVSKTIATGSFAVLSGKAEIVKLKLNKIGRSLLSGDHGRTAASLVIVESLPGPLQTRTDLVQIDQEPEVRSPRGK